LKSDTKLLQLDWFLYSTADYQKAIRVMKKAAELLGDDFSIAITSGPDYPGWRVMARHNKTVRDFLETPEKYLVDQENI